MNTATVDQLRDYIACVFDPDDIVEVRAIRPAEPKNIVEHRWYKARELAARAEAMKAMNAAGFNLYCGVNPRRAVGDATVTKDKCGEVKPCGKCAKCALLARVHFADLDGIDAMQARLVVADKCLPAPTMFIDSGHGAHSYWLLAEPYTDLMEWQRGQQALQQLLGSDEVHDLPRIMRLPGLLNNKRQPFVPCAIIECDADRVYDRAEFPKLKAKRIQPAVQTPADPSRDRRVAIDALNRLQALRADDYKSWIDVGMILHSVDTSASMLAEWNAWSQKSERWEAGECAEKWQTFNPNGKLQLGTLVNWAKADSGDQDFAKYKSHPNGQTQRGDKLAPRFDEAKPKTTPLCDDIGNGQRLIARHGAELRYLGARKGYIFFDGKRWAFDDVNKTEAWAKATARCIYVEASQAADDALAHKLSEHAKKSASAARVAAMLTMARSEPGISIKHDVLDVDPMLFNISNGTIDLRTGKLRQHERADMLTKLAVVVYDPSAKCPLFLAFLDRIMAGNADLIAFLQRAVGYCLTGQTGERCLFILHGSGANGKTVFIETIAALLGDYAKAVPASALLSCRSEERPRNDLAMLAGVRMASATETNEGRKLDEAIVKIVTGGDRISARFLFCEHFTFTPTFKLWMATNHKPEIRGTDDAIWARIRLIPFNVTIPEAERDPELKNKLRTELSGILNWALAGCMEWQQRRLDPPKEVIDATEGYRLEQDQVGEFIEEACVTADGISASASALFEGYCKWCKSGGVDALNQTMFGRRLNDRGFHAERCKITGRKLRCGIGIRAKGATE